MKVLNEKNVVIAVFILMAIIGVLIYDDYGVSWDEPAQRRTAEVYYNRITKGDKYLYEYHNRQYGPFYQTSLFFLDKALGLSDLGSIYRLHRIVNHALFLFSLWCFFLLLKGLFKNRWLALVGVLMIYLSPRIFAHSFFNPKDLPFMCLYIISFYTLYKSLVHRNPKWLILHALACAILLDTRIMGIMVPIGTLAVYLLDLAWGRWSIADIKRGFLFFIPFFLIFSILFWPLLWRDPMGNFIDAFDRMKQFKWEGYVLFGGEYYRSSQVPYWYIPGWASITLPLAYQLFGIIGIIWVGFRFIQQRGLFWKDELDKFALIALAMCLGPWLAVVVLKSTLYDGWRHLYFIYPAFILLALYGFSKLLQSAWVRFAAFAILGLQVTFVLLFMWKSHPHQQVYFNELISKAEDHRLRNYEMDYWGVSFKEALERIAATDKSGHIWVKVDIAPGAMNAEMLSDEDQARLEYTHDFSKAKYYINNYRNGKDYRDRTYDYPQFEEIWNRKVEGNRIISIFKVHKD